jgi:hypothetical protein
MAENETNDQATIPVNNEQIGNVTEAAVHDLQNAIHPIFAHSNFKLSELVCDVSRPVDGVSILPYTREIEYGAMALLLRLVSHLISTDCLLDYWYGVFCNETWPIANRADGDEQFNTVVELEEFRHPEDNDFDPYQEKPSDDDEYCGADQINKKENGEPRTRSVQSNVKGSQSCEDQDT